LACGAAFAVAQGAALHTTDLAARRKQPQVSIEDAAPEDGHLISELFGSVDRLLPFNPTLVAVCCDRPRISGEGIETRLATQRTFLKK
jgi:hypothetical protein